MRSDADKGRGLYRKYKIERTDGGHEPGKRHDGCAYFVLDLTHDQFAAPALLAYASACEDEFPQLAADLRESVDSGFLDAAAGNRMNAADPGKATGGAFVVDLGEALKRSCERDAGDGGVGK